MTVSGIKEEGHLPFQVFNKLAGWLEKVAQAFRNGVLSSL